MVVLTILILTSNMDDNNKYCGHNYKSNHNMIHLDYGSNNNVFLCYLSECNLTVNTPTNYAL